MSRKKAVVLLSGGLDSATVLYVARSKGFLVHCLIFDYGQRHRREIMGAQTIARLARCPAQIIKIKLPWRSSALLDERMALPKASTAPKAPRASKLIPVTYVPGRNTIFLSFALSFAEARQASHIFIGANAIDYCGYPDCRPAFYRAFNRVSRLGTKCGVEGLPVRIVAPLIHMTKAGIIRYGRRLGVPYERTWSCYKGERRPCGVCDSCRLRAKGFKEAGLTDPAITNHV